jgi:hypothetical protein
MRQNYLEDRELRDNCANPGPNQHGFEEYISMLDGPGSPRYTNLLKWETCLHTHGHR